jgi:hypothetical protein
MISNSPKILKQMMEDQWRNGYCKHPVQLCHWIVTPVGLRTDNEPFSLDRDHRGPVDPE